MKWFDELKNSINMKSILTLYGNINDKYLFKKDDGPNYRDLNSFLNEYIVSEGYKLILNYDIVDGLTFLNPKMRLLYNEIMSTNIKEPDNRYQGGFGNQSKKEQHDIGEENQGIKFPSTVDAFLAIRSILCNSKYASCITISYSERLITSTQENDEEKRMHVLLNKFAKEAKDCVIEEGRKLKNICILITDELGNIPHNIYLNNPYSKQILVEKPDRMQREEFIKIFGQYFYLEDGKITRQDLLNFVDLTEGLTNIELVNLGVLSRKQNIPLEKPKELIDAYKFGEKIDYWAQLDMGKIRNAEQLISKRVIGQNEAVRAVVDMVIRAKMGMSGLQHSLKAAKPKGTLLFVGPTGVGKTELAKAAAEFLFGDENACIRFDMSEYNHEHADQRLVGAPPGYVGFEEGGQLTNKIKERPFSVLLFDEIEKAHPRIFDKFLQILEDGRLTDGKGETVYFSESIIIFTSNIGSEKQIKDGMDHDDIKNQFIDAVNDCFRVKWGRPELLNRIGENIVVFQPIKSNEFKKKIINKMLNQVSERINESYGVNIIWDDSIYESIISSPEGFGKNGARGAGNIIEKLIINNLARYLFFNNIISGNTIAVSYDECKGISIN